MQIVEIRLDSGSAAPAMQEMRLWLDARGIAPARFTAAAVAGAVVVRTEFSADVEAEAFADRFAGYIR